jgi:hypothetical protein
MHQALSNLKMFSLSYDMEDGTTFLDKIFSNMVHHGEKK